MTTQTIDIAALNRQVDDLNEALALLDIEQRCNIRLSGFIDRPYYTLEGLKQLEFCTIDYDCMASYLAGLIRALTIIKE